MRDRNILIRILITIGVLLIILLLFLSSRKQINITINKREKKEAIKIDENNEMEISFNKNLELKLNNEKLSIKGIDEKINKYSYTNNILLVSSIENNYIAKIDISKKEVEFKKIDANYNIDKISTCNDTPAIILKNGEKRTINIDKNVIVGQYDCNKYIEKIGDIYLDKDKKIYAGSNVVKYNNTELIIERIYLTTINNENTYYIIANNNLYRLKNNDLKLIGTDLIYNKTKQGLNNYDNMTDEIVYTDNSKSIIKNIKSIYEY